MACVAVVSAGRKHVRRSHESR